MAIVQVAKSILDHQERRDSMDTQSVADKWLSPVVIKKWQLVVLLAPLALLAGIHDDLQLLGSIAGKGSVQVALIKNKGNGQVKAFRVGQMVYDKGTLLSVDRDTMTILELDGQQTVVSSKMGGAWGKIKKAPKVLVSNEEKHIEDGFARVGNKTEVDRNYKDRMLKEELPNILMQASSEPVMEGGEIKGFRLFQFEEGSIFSKLGMKDGDVVQEINGVPLNNVAKTIQFLNGLRNENNVAVSIMRNGVPVQLELKVK